MTLEAKQGYLIGKTYDGLLYCYNGTFIDAILVYANWHHGYDTIFRKAIEAMTTMEQACQLYENYYNENLEVLLAIDGCSWIRNGYIDQEDCKTFMEELDKRSED